MANVKSAGPGVYIISLSQADEWRLRKQAQRENRTITSLLVRLIEGKTP